MRYWRPSVAVFAVALLASLCVHLPIYEALGVLAEVMERAVATERPQVIEFELAPLSEAEVAEPEPDGKVVPEEAEQEAPPIPEPKRIEQAEKRRPLEVPVQPPEPVLAKPEPVPPPPQFEEPEKLAVIQKSDDPEVEPPPDAKYIADENRVVEQETIARQRNMHSDDPEPQPGKPHKSEDSESGDHDEQEVADLRNVEGSDERTPTEQEARHAPKLEHEESAGRREDRAVTRAPATSAPAAEQDPTRASGAESGGQEETLLVEDASGTFRIRKSPTGVGQGERGGQFNPGKPSPHRANREGSEKQPGVNLKLSWSQFESTFGQEKLRAQRQAYLEQKRSRSRGSNRSRQWKKFRAAIENFVPNVRPGNQTALNAARSPFARYLNVVHRRIHREFAHGFLRGLPIAGGPFSDRTLHTKLEIVIEGDGTLHKVGVAKTSGYLPFDYGAFNAVTKAAPFEAPPTNILSGDGRVYVHWGFYRNERQCGTFNARPYILPNPPGTPKPGNGPLRDLLPTPSQGAPEAGEMGMHGWESGDEHDRHVHVHVRGHGHGHGHGQEVGAVNGR